LISLQPAASSPCAFADPLLTPFPAEVSVGKETTKNSINF
jgi:hypothetical protein